MERIFSVSRFYFLFVASKRKVQYNKNFKKMNKIKTSLEYAHPLFPCQVGKNNLVRISQENHLVPLSGSRFHCFHWEKKKKKDYYKEVHNCANGAVKLLDSSLPFAYFVLY